MLRLTVVILLLANLGVLAWTQGLLRPWGLGPVQQAEPHRLAQQLRPEAMVIVRGEEAQRLVAEAANARPPECLATPPLPEAVASAVRRPLAAWPAGSWSLEPASDPGRWILYMGKFAGPEMLAKKKAELRARGVSFEPLANAALEPGLSLGGFTSQAAATEQLAALMAKGVRTARVIQERPEARGVTLKLPAVDEAQRGRLEDLRAVLGGQPLQPCR
ncbi:SPOR domain-containing protein [Ramlibacter sp. MAHUQ-53]|uniref:SPOR domain-containing protein n=1 Tax=unclassified Ramlibacter TaxID=2617605 RepID=UPI00363C17F3